MPQPVIYRRTGNGVGSIHPQAQAWAAQVITNGGAAVSSKSLRAHSNFCYGIDRKGLSTLVVGVLTFAPDSLIACITPLYNPVGANNPWTNNNFLAADLTIDGLLGNGSTKSLDTNYAPSSYATDGSAGVSVYESTTTVSNVCPIGGCASGSTRGLEMFTNSFGTGQQISDCWANSGNGRIINNPGSTLAGFYSMSRTSTSDFRQYFGNNSNPLAQQGSTGTGILGTAAQATGKMSIFCQNVTSDGKFFFSNRRMSFAAFHFGLTLSQTQDLFYLVTKLRTALGGGYV